MNAATETALTDADFDLFPVVEELDFDIFAAPVAKPSVYETRTRATRSRVALDSVRFAALAAK